MLPCMAEQGFGVSQGALQRPSIGGHSMQGTEGARRVQAASHDFTAESFGERRLWLAVVMQAVEEWRNGPLRNRRKAQEFIFEKPQDFEVVCANAGLDAGNLRSRLLKIGQMVNAQTAWSHSFAA